MPKGFSSSRRCSLHVGCSPLCSTSFSTSYLHTHRAPNLTVCLQESDVSASGIGAEKSWQRVCSHVLTFFSFICMVPFAVEEYWTMIKYGRRWVSRTNLLDTATIVFQIIIFTCNMCQWGLHKEIFGIILALQCVFLFSRLQIFSRYPLLKPVSNAPLLCRVLNSGTYFFEIFLAVMYDARYLLAYIFLTGLSASLCLGALYKMDAVIPATDALRQVESLCFVEICSVRGIQNVPHNSKFVYNHVSDYFWQL